ncbi:MAG: DNA-directed RNA polymerase subunit A' [archaeon]
MVEFISKRIERIEFGVLSPKMVKKMAAVKVIAPDTHDTDGYPIKAGLMDPRMGVIDPGLRCRTCKGKMGDCPGHPGYIELARPVLHVGYTKLVYNLLRSTCKDCSRTLLSPQKIDEYKGRIKNNLGGTEELDKIFAEVLSESRKAKKCPHCGEVQLKIKLEKPTTILEGGQRIMPTEIRERLEKIPDDDIKIFGLSSETSRPEWMVLTLLLVPPVTTRPSITLETGERSEDDLTHKLVDILRLNQRLRENIEAGAPHLIVEDQWELVQYHVTTYLDNEVTGVPTARHRSGRPLKTLKQRLKGKEGRFRHSLAGKRVDFSARTVISPDPNISIDEVGIPYEIAMELTIPERATEMNLEALKALIRRGPSNHPGANYVIRPDGKRKKITDENIEELIAELEPGYIIERHLKDGDIVLFNRQPSLHRMSIMAHKVRVLPCKTFRLNLCVCTPYNADFDGDEMNLHVPQTEEARTEARILMGVQTQIRSPRFTGPIIGAIHDHISGLYFLTSSTFTEREAANILARANYDGLLPKSKKGMIDGKQIFSIFLPDDLSIGFKSKMCRKCGDCIKSKCKYNEYVLIRDGELLSGIIDERAIGAMSGRLVDEILRKHGPAKVKDFLDGITKLGIAYLDLVGFTTGLDDEHLPREVRAEIAKVLEKARGKVDELVEKYRAGKLQPSKGKTVTDTLEELIMLELNNGRNKAGEMAGAHLKKENAALVMAKTGARGSTLNITQMSACIGQQAVRGKRILRGYHGRTLPHFKEGDLGAKSRGFVSNSYKGGMDPVEFFLHAMGGRESLTDTAMRTPKSGYLQRRLVNALQDIMVDYNETVKDGRGIIIQFKYGDDGIDPAKSDHGKGVNIKKVIKDVTLRKGSK